MNIQKENIKITITKGNKKLPKETLNFSLPPEKTCPYATSDCKKWCYAKKAYRQYPNVRKSWDENLILSKKKFLVICSISSVKYHT